MFSPTRLVAAAAIIAAAGGAVVVGGLSSQQSEQVPAATSSLLDPAVIAADPILSPRAVRGSIELLGDDDHGQTAIELGQGYFDLAEGPMEVVWRSPFEPRLNGRGLRSELGVQHFQTHTGLRTTAWSIETEDGRRSGTGDAFSRATVEGGFVVLTGAGAYEGLSAYLMFEDESFEGVIFPAGPPAITELRPTE